MANQQAPLDRTLENFMSATAKSTIAVIVPLYGFWADIPDNPVNGHVLKATIDRIYSTVHNVLFVFVAHPQSLPNDVKDPSSVGNVLKRKVEGGNVVTIPVSRDATYTEYVKAGMEYATEETKAQFVMVFNPWVMVQYGAVDVIVDRANQGDNAAVSGYDVGTSIEWEKFNSFNISIPKEEWDFIFDFVTMPRFLAESITIDTQFLTHRFAQRDIWQQVARQNFVVISSQRVPIYPFNFPWNDYETKEQFELDKQYFARKWGFDPGLIYKDVYGKIRKDK